MRRADNVQWLAEASKEGVLIGAAMWARLGKRTMPKLNPRTLHR
jgi:hypothetical protein